MTRIQPWTEEQLMTHEQVFEGLVSKAIRQTVKAAISSFKKEVTTAAAEPAPAIEYSTLEGTVLATWENYVNSELFPFLTDTFLTSAERVADAMTAASGELVETITNTYAKDFLAYAHNRMVNTGQELWEKIRGELVAGYEAGEGVDQLANRLMQSAGLALPRALTVARTEVISAANGGSYVQMLDAGFDEQVTKEWLATMDPRTRESHRHADNQTVDLTDGFNVDIYTSGVKTGTEELEFPGDPSGTPGNVINCRCALAFNFEDDDEDEEVMTAAKDFVEVKHPRDKDGKFKKKGAPDLYVKIPETAPANTAPKAEKAAFIVAKKWPNLTPNQKLVLIQNLDDDTWKKLPPELKDKVKDAPNATSHPETKNLMEKAIAALPEMDEPDDDADTDARPTGGTVTKTGKKWTPGQPVAMKVQFLYNTTFEPGAVMAVRKDSNERLVWNGKKIERQSLKDGKFQTTETLTRGDFYKKYNAEEGWTIPDGETPSAQQTVATPGPALAAPGKPIALKVQVLYNAKYDAGQTIAERVGSNERLVWNGKKIERQKWDGSSWQTSDTVTRGKAYQLWKDEDGWTTPTGAVGGTQDQGTPENVAPEAPEAVSPAQVPAFETVTEIGTKQEWNKSLKSMQDALHDPAVLDGSTLFDQGDIKISKKDDGIALMEVEGQSKSLYPEELTPDGFINHALTLKAKNKTKPAAKSAAPVIKKPTPAAYKAPDALGGEGTDTILKAGIDPSVPQGTVLFETSANGTTTKLTKSGPAQITVDHTNANGGTGSAEFDALGAQTLDIIKAINFAQDKSKVSVGTVVEDVTPDLDSKIADWKAGDIDDFSINDVMYEDDVIEIEKLNAASVMLINKKNGEFKQVDLDDLTLEQVEDFKEQSASPVALPAPQVSGPVTYTKAKKIIKDTQDDSIHVLAVLFEDEDVTIIKGGSGNIGIASKKSGGAFHTLAPDEINENSINQLINDMKSGNAPSPVPVATSSPTISKDKAATIKTWAETADIKAGEELHNGADFKVVKGAAGSVIVYKKGPDGHIDSNSGVVLSSEQVTQENLIGAIGMATGGQPGTAAPIALPGDTTPVGALPDPSTLKFTGQTIGTHHGKVYKDGNGNQYLFKAAPSSNFKAGVYADLATAKLHDKLGLDTPPTEIVNLDGQFGSLQLLFPNVKEPFPFALDPKTLDDGQILEIQKEHIFDWLVANHDAHGKNLLQQPNGLLVGIDKGQAFKWFGADPLDWNFKPNEHPQAALQIYKAFAEGEDINIFNPSTSQTLKNLISKIKNIPDDEYKAMLRPYAEQAAKDGVLGKGGPASLGIGKVPFPPNDVEAFLNAAVARKNNIGVDLQDFYDKAVAARALKKGLPSSFVPTPVSAGIPKSVPMKLSYNVLVNPKTTKYSDGQVIAEHPVEKERLVWNGKTKKFDVFAQDDAGTWTKIHSYTKQGAYKDLKDDAGWHTPSTPQVDNIAGNTPGQAATPTVEGNPSGGLLTLPKAKPASPEVFEQSRGDISHLSPTQKQAIFDHFKKQTSAGNVYLSSSGDTMFQAIMDAQIKWGKDNPTEKLSMLQIANVVDDISASKASVPNTGAYKQKVYDWLKTSAGAEEAGKKLLELNLTPAQKIMLGLDKVIKIFKAKKLNKGADSTPSYLKVDAVPISQPKAAPGDVYKVVPSVSAGNNIWADIVKHHGELTPEQRAASKVYTTNPGYEGMNGFMRSFGKNHTKYAKDSLLLQQGMKPSTQPMLLYRNVDTVFDGTWTPTVQEIKDLVAGGKDKFFEDGFSSSSIDPNVFGSKKYRFLIDVPVGTPMVWVEGKSAYNGEKEFVLGAGLKFEVYDSEEIGSGWNQKIAIRMRVVPK